MHTLAALTLALTLNAANPTSAPPHTPPTHALATPLPARRISLDLHRADLREVIALFARESGVNIVAAPEVQGTVTLWLRDVPLRQAFNSLLRSQHLVAEPVGAVLLVRPER